MDNDDKNKSNFFWSSYLNLEQELLTLSKYIFFTDFTYKNKDEVVANDNQLKTFSTYIADLLIQCCVQIEAISKELYQKITKTNDTKILFDKVCIKHFNQVWNTDTKKVIIASPYFNFRDDNNKFLYPLKKSYSGNYWTKAYQAVKHDRFYCLHQGNVKAVIQAMAALYLLNVYYKSSKFTVSYNNFQSMNWSHGSSIFSICAPKVDINAVMNLDKIKACDDSSPYVIDYIDYQYNKIKKMQEEQMQKLWYHINQIPEYHDKKFSELKKNKSISNIVGALYTYILNKQIPDSLSFSERKKLLLNSEAIKCKAVILNKNLLDDITEDNIQDKINQVGFLWGHDIALNQFNLLKAGKCTLIYDLLEIHIPTPEQ